MQIAILFDEKSTAHKYYAGHTARQQILGSGVLQACGRMMVVRAGTVLAGNQQRIADSGSVFIGTIILRRQQQHSNDDRTE